MPRNTGPSRDVKAVVAERDGWACARCGRTIDPWPGLQFHHRVRRGMGGSTDPRMNYPSNLVLLDSGCHSEVESRRDQAYKDGWLAHWSMNPANVPVQHAKHGLCMLNHDGSVTVIEPLIPRRSDETTLDEVVRARQDEKRKAAG